MNVNLVRNENASITIPQRSSQELPETPDNSPASYLSYRILQTPPTTGNNLTRSTSSTSNFTASSSSSRSLVSSIDATLENLAFKNSVLERDQLKENLEEWCLPEYVVKKPSRALSKLRFKDTKMKMEISRKILAAYDKQSMILDLKKCGLKSIPTGLLHLRYLEILDLDNNQLKEFPLVLTEMTQLKKLVLSRNFINSIPKEIANLVHLKILYIQNFDYKEDGFGISSLPKEIGHLVSLEELSLSNNNITELPESFGNLTSLKMACFSFCNLTSLPNSLGNLSELNELYLYGNKELSSLPFTLGNCQDLEHLDIENTQIPPAEGQAILQRCEKLRNSNGVLNLATLLDTWKQYGDSSHTFAFLMDRNLFTSYQAGQIGEWLRRLESCQDFRNNRKKLANIVCEILNTLQSKEFAHTFFSLLADNLERCGDRSAMLLNMIYSDWMLHHLSNNDTAQDQERITLMKGVAKTLALRNCIDGMIKNFERTNQVDLEEGSEIRLYYEVTLKDKLGLITAVEEMLYRGVGCRQDVVDENVLSEIVEREFLDIFYNLTSLDQFLSSHKVYGKEYAEKKKEIELEFRKELEMIEFFYDMAIIKKEKEEGTSQNITFQAEMERRFRAALHELKTKVLLTDEECKKLEHHEKITIYADENEYIFDCGVVNQKLNSALVDLRKSLILKIGLP